MKVREDTLCVKVAYLAIGISMAGEKEILDLWLAQTEGAMFDDSRTRQTELGWTCGRVRSWPCGNSML
jgi:transposase-like protein